METPNTSFTRSSNDGTSSFGSSRSTSFERVCPTSSTAKSSSLTSYPDQQHAWSSSVGSRSSSDTRFCTPRVPSGRLRTPVNSYGSTPHSTSASRNTPVPRSTPFNTSSATPGDNTSILIAIVEGRGLAKGEIGMASLDLKCPVLNLSQFADSQTYVKLMTKLNILEPIEIILPNTTCDAGSSSKLFEQISECYRNVKISSVPRKYFNEEKGLHCIRRLCLPEYLTVEMQIKSKCKSWVEFCERDDLDAFFEKSPNHLTKNYKLCSDHFENKYFKNSISKNRYYCLAATNALLTYIEFSQNIVYAPASVKIVFKSSEQTLMIDVSTVKNLELLQNARNPRSLNSLFGALNHTKTQMGARLLRVNILEPLCDLERINMRQEIVSELTENENRYHKIRSAIGRFLDLDHLLSMIIQIPKVETVKTADSKLTTIIYLKHTIELIDGLKDAIEGSEICWMKGLHKICSDEQFGLIFEKIQAVIQDDTRYHKGSLAMKIQKCFAIKTSVNGLLDIARRTYSEIIDDINELVKQMATTYNLPLKTSYSTNKGFYIQMATLGKSKQILPDIFVKRTETKNMLSFTTVELIRFNDRVKESLNEIYIMSGIEYLHKTVMALVGFSVSAVQALMYQNGDIWGRTVLYNGFSVLTQLMSEIHPHIGCLHKLTEWVALLDVMSSFAYSSINCQFGYTRPDFTDTLAIKNGRHPILEKLSSDTIVPNSTYASDDSNFVIISGPNMSGKSTYLRQIALLQIMAQIGSFVPAEHASFRIANQIFSRIGSEDDIETNASTFMIEMKEINYIIKNADYSSLIIIDELGRGTSVDEGIAICHAICEYLRSIKAFTFYATHFKELMTLDTLYPNVENYHFEVQHVFNDEKDCNQMQYTHVISKGKLTEEHYGLHLAEVSSLPREMIENAKQLSQMISNHRQNRHEMPAEIRKERAVFKLSKCLEQVATSSLLDPESLSMFLKFQKDKFLNDFVQANNVTS